MGTQTTKKQPDPPLAVKLNRPASRPGAAPTAANTPALLTKPHTPHLHTPADLLRLQRLVGNQAATRHLARAANALPVTRAPGSLIQRTLSPAQENRLKQRLGQGKFTRAKAAGQLEYFNTLSNQELAHYLAMPNVEFDKLLGELRGSRLGAIGETVGNLGGLSDMAGAALETGEAASSILQGTDAVLEGTGGGISGIKDAVEGGTSIKKQWKPVEGGLTLLGGLSGIASAIPGVPDAFGIAAGGAKTGAGITKVANAAINRNALAKLKTDAGGNGALAAALDVLETKISVLEGIKQTVLGGAETVGSILGGPAKYGTALVSKGIETLPGWGEYLGRAALSYTGLVSSNAQKKADEDAEKLVEKTKMRAAVVSTTGTPAHIGRLRRLAVLIDPDLAEEIDRAVGAVDATLQPAIEAAIKQYDTWNPS